MWRTIYHVKNRRNSPLTWLDSLGAWHILNKDDWIYKSKANIASQLLNQEQLQGKIKMQKQMLDDHTTGRLEQEETNENTNDNSKLTQQNQSTTKMCIQPRPDYSAIFAKPVIMKKLFLPLVQR